MTDPAPTDAAPGTAAATGFLTEALRAPLAADGVRVVTVPAPAGAAEELLRAAGRAVFWSIPGGAVHVGLGAAHTIVAGGVHRFDGVREQALRLWPRIDPVPHPDVSPAAPRLFGGFAFLHGPLPAEWRDFGESMFVLPRLLYTADAAGGQLSVAVSGEELERSGTSGIEAEAGRLLERLGRPAADPGAPGAAAASAGGAPERRARAEWARAVASIQRRLDEGDGDKIVAARSRRFRLENPPDLPAILRRLSRESATAARFAFRFGRGVFVGATPERLVGRTGREVRTEALAGTVPAGSPEREARLLESMKDSVEHRYVVRAIVEALAPLCEALDHPDEPRIQRLRHVVHLQTPFVGRLREPTHVLELVQRLHPTPAVGGWPTAPALRWIAREEPGSRGWYAGPVGWFDAGGDGEFGVALRSGLLHRTQAHLYAGAGIVRGSDAAAEFDETEVKLRTMLDALGIRP